jgi:GST-like protein
LSWIIVASWVAAIVSARIRAEDPAYPGAARPAHLGKKMTLNHPIFTRWPTQYPDRLQLFSAPTPNGVKVGIMLEETSLAYEPHRIDIVADESHDPAFLALNPNGKIPAIYDPDGPSGTPLALFESGAILLYLADKTGQFISSDANTRYETIQWVMWQMGGVGPMFGQVGFFNKFAGKAYEDKRPRDRYATESARLLGVLDERLAGRDWVMGADYSIADISLLGWVRNLIGFYEARELVGFDRFLHVQTWLNRGLARPAVQRGLEVTAV